MVVLLFSYRFFKAVTSFPVFEDDRNWDPLILIIVPYTVADPGFPRVLGAGAGCKPFALPIFHKIKPRECNISLGVNVTKGTTKGQIKVIVSNCQKTEKDMKMKH